MTGDVWLIRHAQTEWTKSHRHTGRTDLPLTTDGERTAAALRDRLAGQRFASVLSSPLVRAQRTAQLAGLTDVDLLDDLVEWDYGAYEGLTTPQILEQNPDWVLWRDGCPDGDRPGDVAARADRAIGLARDRATSGDVAVVAHGHLLRVFGARWCEQPVALGERLKLGTAAICVLSYEHGAPAIDRWNQT